MPRLRPILPALLALAAACAPATGGNDPDFTCPTGWRPSGDRCVRAAPGAGFMAACSLATDCGCMEGFGHDDPYCEGTNTRPMDCYVLDNQHYCSIHCDTDTDCRLDLGDSNSGCYINHCRP